MYMFLVYTLLIYIISNGIGKLFLKENNKIYNLRVPVGFLCFLGVLQIFYYPLQYFHISSNYSFYITLIISIVFLIIGITKIKKEDFQFLKDYHFWLLVVFFFVVMKIIPSIDATDDEFYFPFIIDNAYNKINSIHPQTGQIYNMDPLHAYQGYYLFVSFLYRIQHTLFNSFIDIFVSFRTTFTLLFTIYFSNLLSFIKEKLYIKNNKYIYYVLELLSILLIGVHHLNHIYYGSFVLFTIYIPVLIIIYNNYLKEKNNIYIIMTLLSGFGLLSFASSSLFLILILLSVMFSYEVIVNKKINFINYIVFSIPVLVYLCFITNCLYMILLIPIVFLIFKKINNSINKFFLKWGKYIIYIVPIIFILGSLIYKNVLNLSLFSKSILVFNTFMVLLLLYFALIKKEKINFIIFSYILTVIIFYNPLTATFVSKIFTTEDVFYRISFITKNPLVIISIFVFILNALKNKKIYKYGIYLLIIGLTVIYCKNIYTLMIKNDDYNYKYNYILRESYETLDLGEKITNISGNVVSLDYSVRIYNPSLKVKLYRFLKTNNSADSLFKVLFYNDNINSEFENDIKEYDYIVSQNKYNTNLSEYYECIYSNEKYSLYKVGGEKNDRN